jgi:hypothetical protein
MKSLNTKSTEIFTQLAAMADQNNGHVKIRNNDSFMAVSVERLYDFHFGGHSATMYSIAHYGELNGDLMSDPEMTFIYISELKKVYPCSFTNHYAGEYRETIFQEKETWKIDKRNQADQADFANVWMVNIKEQQEL